MAHHLVGLGQGEGHRADLPGQPLRITIPGNQRGEAARIKLVLGDQYAGGEGVGRVSGQDRHRGLPQNWPLIEIGGDEVNGAAAMAVARLQRAVVGVEAGVFGQQRRVDVQHPSLPAAHEPGREDAHIARQRDEPRAAAQHLGFHRGIMIGPGNALVRQAESGHALGGGQLQPTGIRVV